MKHLVYDLANILIDVAMEVIDALVATQNHEILLLSRKVLPSYLTGEAWSKLLT